jgi:N-acetylmuramic acid 6-phosphate (MurNAc-6-P) etherase
MHDEHDMANIKVTNDRMRGRAIRKLSQLFDINIKMADKTFSF